MASSTLQLLLLAGLLLTTAAGGIAGLLLWRRRRERRHREQLEAMRAVGLHLPPSLHPVIDPEICIGSLACVRACPEGDILGLVEGAARLIEGARCIGHGRCADECPVDAIRLVFGTSERGVDLPRLGPHFESSRPGVHVVGELGGMGLIKNAIRQGLELGGYLASSLPATDRSGELVDVAIVGAGPAGIATAAALRDAGRTFALLERESLGGTVAHYPRQKLVMTEPVTLPGFGRFGRSEMRKEELIEAFEAVLERLDIEVREGCEVQGIDGEAGHFIVQTTLGPVRARRVALAIGRRGSPRKLGVEGETLSKVTYRLVDPRQYDGARVLVVGGGDAALESAIMLAEESDAEVAIAYRREAFGRCRPKNKERIEALITAGQVTPFFQTEVQVITKHEVVLDVAGQSVRLPNDYVIVNIGGELPTPFLQKLGVEVERHHGQKSIDRGEPSEQAGTRRRRRILFALGATITAALAAIGWDYYWLPLALRETSPLHTALRPSGLWGHGIGVVATTVMLLNFSYAARKRWGPLRRVGSLQAWLDFHLFVGFLSPAVIAFHAAFQSRNLLATVTSIALLVVVATGIIGRFLWGLVFSPRTTPLGKLFAAKIEGHPERRGALRRLLSACRAFHFALAILMLLVIAAHVTVSVYLGYRWIF